MSAPKTERASSCAAISAPGAKALLSPATQFLFKLIDTFSATFSTLDPVKAKGRTFVRDSA